MKTKCWVKNCKIWRNKITIYLIIRMWWIIMRTIGWERKAAARNKINPFHHKKWSSLRTKWTEFENTHALIKPKRLRSRFSKFLNRNDDIWGLPITLFMLYYLIFIFIYSLSYSKMNYIVEKYFVSPPVIIDYLKFVGK